MPERSDPWDSMPSHEYANDDDLQPYAFLAGLSLHQLKAWLSVQTSLLRELDAEWKVLPDLEPTFKQMIVGGSEADSIQRNAQLSGKHFEAFEGAMHALLKEGYEPAKELQDYLFDHAVGLRSRPRMPPGRSRNQLRDFHYCRLIHVVDHWREDLSPTRNDSSSHEESIIDLLSDADGTIGYEAIRKVWLERRAQFRR